MALRAQLPVRQASSIAEDWNRTDPFRPARSDFLPREGVLITPGWMQAEVVTVQRYSIPKSVAEACLTSLHSGPSTYQASAHLASRSHG